MNFTIELDEGTCEILFSLASERRIGQSFMLTSLAKAAIKEVDENRHIQFQPGKGFVRVNCGLPGCKETGHRIRTYGD